MARCRATIGDMEKTTVTMTREIQFRIDRLEEENAALRAENAALRTENSVLKDKLNDSAQRRADLLNPGLTVI